MHLLIKDIINNKKILDIIIINTFFPIALANPWWDGKQWN